MRCDEMNVIQMFRHVFETMLLVKEKMLVINIFSLSHNGSKAISLMVIYTLESVVNGWIS